MAKKEKKEKVVKDLTELGKALDEKKKEELKAAIAGPTIDTEAIKKLLETDNVPTDVAENHKAYREKVVETGKLVEELFDKKSDLKKSLDGIRRNEYSPAKEAIIEKIREITTTINDIYEKMPEVKNHVEYEFFVKCAGELVERAEAGEDIHFGHLQNLLNDLMEEKMAEGYEGMTFKEAREKFPKAKVIMYRGYAVVVPGYKLGNALLKLRDLCIKNAEAKRAEAEKKAPKPEADTTETV